MSNSPFDAATSANAAAGATILPLPARAPERLVGVGFRCWLAGLSSGDIRCWEEAWNTYSGTLGPGNAKDLLIDLSKFVRAVKASANRDIEISPSGCRGFCRDECLAISIIAASQHGAHPALTASAEALLGSGDIGDAINGAQTLAGSLRRAKQMLSPESICPATCALRAMTRRRTAH
jgi:hypothetical protein